MKPFLSVIIPCYNEEKNLKRGVLDEVENYLQKQKYQSEVIISDDESTDGSLQFIKNYLQKHPRFRLLENKHAGKPFAIRAGIKKPMGKLFFLPTWINQRQLMSLINFCHSLKKGLR